MFWLKSVVNELSKCFESVFLHWWYNSSEFNLKPVILMAENKKPTEKQLFELVYTFKNVTLFIWFPTKSTMLITDMVFICDISYNTIILFCRSTRITWRF